MTYQSTSILFKKIHH